MALHTLPFALIYDDLLSDAGRIEGGRKDAAELVSEELCRDERKVCNDHHCGASIPRG